eukprot:4295535-Amphidinium_carterae.2
MNLLRAMHTFWMRSASASYGGISTDSSISAMFLDAHCTLCVAHATRPDHACKHAKLSVKSKHD